MTQATGGGTFFEAMVEIKVAGGAWTDISGWGSSVARSGGDRQSGEAYTFDGDTAILGEGKRQPQDITVRTLYTEGVADPYQVVLPAFRAHTMMQVRWSPLGGHTNQKRYTTDPIYSIITSCPPPAGEAGSGDPIMFEFVVHTSDVTQDMETT